jgi:hypothetical protein
MARWRVGSVVAVPNAFRYLEVAQMAAAREVRAAATFTTNFKGKEIRAQLGDVYRASDPVVKGREELFEKK